MLNVHLHRSLFTDHLKFAFLCRALAAAWNLQLELGRYLTFQSATNPFGGSTYANIVGDIPKDFGKLTATTRSGTYTYFPGWTQVTDPGKASVTTTDNLQASNNNMAVQDANGNLIMVQPATGTTGNMGPTWLRGPKSINLDANLIKRIGLTERKTFEIRLDAINVLNHPNYGTPTRRSTRRTSARSICRTTAIASLRITCA